jgi:hypothetical protein
MHCIIIVLEHVGSPIGWVLLFLNTNIITQKLNTVSSPVTFKIIYFWLIKLITLTILVKIIHHNAPTYVTF